MHASLSPIEPKSPPIKLNKIVFIGSAVVSVLLIILTILFPVVSETLLSSAMGFVSNQFGWYYMLVVAGYSVFSLYVAFSKFGDIKLGQDHEKAQFPFLAWSAMLFSAGIGIDLLFFGVSEPLMHYLTPHPDITPASAQAMREALPQAFLHWGLHGWGIYALIGMALAYFSYRKHMPLALRSALVPIFGKKSTNGWVGHSVDMFGVVCTLLGIATSLGIGVLQANAGLTHVFGIESSKLTQSIIILVVAAAAAISAVTGVEKGVRRLSELCMLLATLLLLTILFLGDTTFLLNALTQNVGDYFQTVVTKSFDTYAYNGDEGAQWKSWWTIFFWAWWVAWAPFVGLFIARISRGRTLREFVLGVMFIPLGFIFAWFSIFGNSAISLVASGATALGDTAINDAAMGMFALFEYYPASSLLSIVAVLVGLIFFVTSADSGALVLANLSTKELSNETDAPVWLRLFWAMAVGLVTLGLLFAGGFGSLQSVSVIAGLPFSFVLILYAISMFKALKEEGNKRKVKTMDTTYVLGEGRQWKNRLHRIISMPSLNEVNAFLQNTVFIAMDEFCQAMSDEKRQAQIQWLTQKDDTKAGICLDVKHGETQDFCYAVHVVEAERPNFTLSTSQKNAERYYRAEVYLQDGSQEYDLVGYTKEQILIDIINQYERHIQYLHLESH